MNEKKFENFMTEYFSYIKSLENRITDIEKKLGIKTPFAPEQNPDDYLERKNRFSIFKNEDL